MKFAKVFWLIMLEGNVSHKPKSPNVKIFEWPDIELRRKVFNASNFFVNVNKFDYRSVYSLQAMACDLPIVTPYTGYFSKKWDLPGQTNKKNNMLTDFGFVVRKPDLSSYKHAVDDLIASSYRGERFNFRPRDHFDAVDHSFEIFACKWRMLLEEKNNKL